MKTQTLLVMAGVVLILLGCTLRTETLTTSPPLEETDTHLPATAPEATDVPATLEPTTEPASEEGTPVSHEDISFLIPPGLADGASADTMTAVESNTSAPWDIAPTHYRFTLTGYPREETFHEPRIFIYPATEYAQMNDGAAEQIENTRRILAGGTMLLETLPRVPSFNAQPLIAAQIQRLPFQNGDGVRSLTQYAQYAAPINNHELFYHFTGLTSDGEAFIVAILPIRAPILAEDEKPDASVPEGGVPIPTELGINTTYYVSVTERLNSLAPDAFEPTLNQLDALIQSLLVH